MRKKKKLTEITTMIADIQSSVELEDDSVKNFLERKKKMKKWREKIRT